MADFDLAKFNGFILWALPNKTILLDFLSAEARQSVIMSILREFERSFKPAPYKKVFLHENLMAIAYKGLDNNPLGGILSKNWRWELAYEFATVVMENPQIKQMLTDE